MRLKFFILLAAAKSSSGQTLADVLQAQSDTLSTLNSWLDSQQLIFTILSSAQGVTLLAPSNNALNQLYNTALVDQLAQDPNLLTAFLSYHVLNGVFSISDFMNTQSLMPLRTFLEIEAFSNVTGGQRILSSSGSQNGSVSFHSGNGGQANVQPYDLNYVGGTVHIIDSVLTLPASITNSLITAGLTAALGAFRRAGIEDTLNLAADVTIFAPNNEAFNAIGSLVDSMSIEQLTTVLNYHVVQGKVLYTHLIAGGQELTAEGGILNFRTENGALFVNSARVVRSNVLVANGVLHVVDGVLNPANSTATPNPSASTPEPAFNGASSTSGGVPFTSSIPTVTSPATPAVSTNPDQGGSSGGGSGRNGDGRPVVALAAQARTAAFGVAALLCGAVALVNL